MATLGTMLTEKVHHTAQQRERQYVFEGKTAHEWMQETARLEDTASPQRDINRAARIANILECMNDTSEE